MTVGYTLEFQIRDLFIMQLCASHEAALGCFYETLLDYYPDQSLLVALPEPITEDDLRKVIEDQDLRARFSITAAWRPRRG